VGVGVGLAAGWDAGSSAPGATTPRPAGAAKSAPVFHGELVSYNSCDALLAALRAKGRAIVGPYGFSGGAPYAASGRLAAGVPFASSASGATLQPEIGDTQQALTHSDTNNQVDGVDEPDVVKTDGRVMVSLDGQQVHVVDVRQPRLRSTLALPYPGSELLLAGDQAVVLTGSTTGGGTLNFRYPSGAGSDTVATVIDLSHPDTPRITRTFTFDASELAARVVNGTIRLVVSSPPPTATWATPTNATAAELARTTKINQSIVDALPLDAWLPHWSDGTDKTTRVSACDAVAIPDTPAKETAAGMVTVVSLDPTKAAPGAGTSAFGTASTVYAESTHLYVSDSGYGSRFASGGGFNPTASSPKLHLLEFDIADPTQARFLASGTVSGQLHDSYALSEYQNALRVTTTTTDGSYTTSTGITVLQRQGDRLVQTGRVTGLGTGEQVYAVRYVGDRGYVVTFQQIDPLHVVDLSNPAKPVLRGTLELSGFSTLLQPLPNHRLLGIGRAVSGAGCTGLVTCPAPVPIESTAGLQMVLFDVTDAAHPKVLDKQVLTGSYAVDPNSPHTVTADPAKVTDGGYFVMPSTNGLLGIRVASNKITLTTGAFSKPYTVQTGRAVFAGSNVFELGDRGVTVRRSADLHQTGWVAF
jgi:uncharacterized secreted protein with C-terminal beta-propeller domain